MIFKKKVKIAIKSKEINSQLKPVSSYVTITHQPVIASSNTCSQMHISIKHSLAIVNLQVKVSLLRIIPT